MADANTSTLVYSAAESTYGTPPGGNWTKLPIVSHDIKLNSSEIVDPTIRADRAIEDRIPITDAEGGPVAFALKYGPYDTWLEWLLLADSTWGSVQTNTGTYSIAGTALTTGAGTDADTGLAVGDLIRIKDGSTVIGYTWVAALPGAGAITLGHAVGNITGDADEEVERGGAITEGVNLQTFSAEHQFQELATTFTVDRGMAITGLTLNSSVDNIVTGSFQLIGKDEVSGTVTAAGTPTTPTSGPVFSTHNMFAIVEGSTAVNITAFNLALANGLAARKIMGTEGVQSIRRGTCDITGGFEMFMSAAAQAILDKYRGRTASNVLLVLQDDNGNAYGFNLPNIKFSDGGHATPGQNDDIKAAMSFGGILDATFGHTINLTRWAA